MTRIAVIDYGMGNLHSVAKALEFAAREHGLNNIKIDVGADPAVIAKADKVLLPGVGAMRDCMGEMQRMDLIDSIQLAVKSRPFLGICIGMQALMTHSQENGGVACLDIIRGEVVHFAKNNPDFPVQLKIPHMGWNQVQQQIRHPLWQGIAQQQRFYFVHSYYVLPEQPAPIAASADYGITFTAAISQDNVFAVQFHPEKSAESGLQFFSNFLRWDGQV